jgi:hypothetical protein
MQHAPEYPHGFAVVDEPHEVFGYQTRGDGQFACVVVLQAPVAGSQHAPVTVVSGQTLTPPEVHESPPTHVPGGVPAAHAAGVVSVHTLPRQHAPSVLHGLGLHVWPSKNEPAHCDAATFAVQPAADVQHAPTPDCARAALANDNHARITTTRTEGQRRQQHVARVMAFLLDWCAARASHALGRSGHYAPYTRTRLSKLG